MKRLTLVRHGNAEWKNPHMDDSQRPLNKRGIKEAESIARRLLELDWIPDVLVSSPAARTRATAEILAKIVMPKRLKYEERLYLAPVDDILAVIRTADPFVTHLMLVGHNPGISEAAKLLAANGTINELSTACACSIVFKSKVWREIGPDAAFESSYEAPAYRFQLWA